MKKFKSLLIMFTAMTFGFIQRSNAQKQPAGLYLTGNDYLNHKLSYSESPDNPDGNKIHFHDFMGTGEVTVISNGKRIAFDKAKIFGYHSSDGSDYRFQNKKSYQIIDTVGFYTYGYDKLVQQGKGPKPVTVYFFSRKPGDAIIPLTLANVAKAFPENEKLKYIAEAAAVYDIKSDVNVNGSDAYKIKELYTESLK